MPAATIERQVAKLLELLSRIRALIRRNAFQNFVSSDLVIDTNNMTVKKNNQNIYHENGISNSF